MDERALLHPTAPAFSESGGSIQTSKRTYVIFEMESRHDDYRVFSYITRIIECISETTKIEAQVLGPYSGPKFLHGNVNVNSYRTPRRAPHSQGLSRLLRLALNKLRFNANYHWFSDLSGDQFKAISWIEQRWTNEDANAILFAKNQASGLKLVELVYLYAPIVPKGIILILLNGGEIDPVKSEILNKWGVVVYKDHSLSTSSVAGSAQIRSYDFNSPIELPLQPRKLVAIDWPESLANALLKERDPEKVLFIRPDWMKCGSATTFTKLTNLYRKRGAILVDVALQPYRQRYTTQVVAKKLQEVEADLAPSVHFNFCKAILPIAIFKIAINFLRSWPRSIAGFIPIFYQQCATPSKALVLLRKARIDYLYVNHYFTLPQAKKLFPGKPVFLDTHDIQSLNFVSHDYHHHVRMRASPFTACLQEELRVMDIADRITIVSQEEIELIQCHRPYTNYFYYIPIPSICTGKPQRRGRKETHESKATKLLIVASRNPSNERSLNWFFKSIWPALAKQGVQLDVVGGINTFFQDKTFTGVTFLGIVEDLSQSYSAADVVVLPITNGGGIAIKTLEAIQHGKPIATTRHAMRGLPDQVKEILPGALSEGELIKDLQELIGKPDYLAGRAAAVRNAGKLLADWDFDGRMQVELDGMLALAASYPGVLVQRTGGRPGKVLPPLPDTVDVNPSDPGFAEAILKHLQLSLAPANRSHLTHNDFQPGGQTKGKIRVDGEPGFIPEMLKRQQPHDDDYTIFRIFTDPNSLILDIGANWGYSVGSIWAAGAASRVVSFEAIPLYRDCLQEINRIHPERFDFFLTALSSHNGKARFVVPVVNDLALTALTTGAEQPSPEGLAHNVVDYVQRWLPELKKIRFCVRAFDVPVRRLDDVMLAHPFVFSKEPVVAIKIDVEGLEYEVLKGCGHLLKSLKPLVMAEGGNRTEGLAGFMEALGYLYAERKGEKLALVIEQGSAANGFFLHESRLPFYRDSGIL